MLHLWQQSIRVDVAICKVLGTVEVGVEAWLVLALVLTFMQLLPDAGANIVLNLRLLMSSSLRAIFDLQTLSDSGNYVFSFRIFVRSTVWVTYVRLHNNTHKPYK